MKTIGDKVKELREQKGWSQDYLAEMAEISQTTIWRLENGKLKRGLPKNLVKTLAAALDVSPDTLEEQVIKLDHLPEDILNFVKDPNNLNEVRKAIYPLIVKRLEQEK